MDMTSQRQAIIKEHYYFTCQCEFCLDEHRDDMMRSIRCFDKKCSGALPLTMEFLPTSCTQCGKSAENGEKLGKTAAMIMSDTKDAVTNYEEMFANSDASPSSVAKLLAARQSLLQVYEKVRRVLFPLNIFYIKMIVHLAENETDLGWRLYLEETDAYRYYHGLSAFLGIRLVLQGGLQVAAQQFDEATKSLEEAERILKVTHGTDHPMYIDMMKVKEKQIPQLRRMTKQVEQVQEQDAKNKMK